MDVKTYRASSMHEALQLVRSDLGPAAAVLHTRELRGGLWRWLTGGRRQVEVVASCSVHVPSRLSAEDLQTHSFDDDTGENDFGQPDDQGSDQYEDQDAYGVEDAFDGDDADRLADEPRDVTELIEQETLGEHPLSGDWAVDDWTDGPSDGSTTNAAMADLFYGTHESKRRSQVVPQVDPENPPQQPLDIASQLADLQSAVMELCRQGTTPASANSSIANFLPPAVGHGEAGSWANLPPALFDVYTDLIEAELSEDIAREYVHGLRQTKLDDPAAIRSLLARRLENEIQVCGPIRVQPGTRRLVALVGPTGVGKTTTIAKLAANFHLRERCRVGLITVDTYRIAAVEQLRTYADIIDLPMEVVATPREMRQAVDRLSDFDLVLLDTAGRSPRDEVKIQELKSMLAEARADEVQLVLSSVASAASLRKTAAHFGAVGTTSLVLTKLDEATGLGNVIPLLRSSRLPVSYVTNGQNVPDDIEAADSSRLARIVLGMNSDR